VPTFAEDTSIEAIGDSRWRATYADERWGVLLGPFGGFLTALLTRALLEVTECPPRSLSIHFLAAPKPGEVELSAVVERRGGSSDGVLLRLEQGGATMALALANAGAWRDGAAWDDGVRPDAPPPEDCVEIRRRPELPAFISQLDVRWVAGSSQYSDTRENFNLSWVRLGSGEPTDLVALAAISDVWMPPAFGRLGAMAIVPTLDMTVHFRAPVPEGLDWVLIEHRTLHGAGGTWTCDGTLWAPGGTVLAQVRQQAMLRTLPA
jgi:acyl-CoA thioesterase